MSNVKETHAVVAYDRPVEWPRAGEGLGLSQGPFFDEQMGVWIVSKSEDILRVVTDPETFSSQMVTGPARAVTFAKIAEKVAQDPRATTAQAYYHLPTLGSDGEAHRREISFIGRAFTPTRVRAREPMIQKLCEELVSSIVERSSVPFMREFAVPLPVQLIAHLLGLPSKDIDDLKRWSEGFQGVIGSPDPTAEAVLEAFLSTSVEFTDYMVPLIEQRRREPVDDIVSTLASPNDVGDTLNTEEILAMCSALLMAGNETTTAALGGIMLYVTRVPDLQEKIRADMGAIPSLVEEGLRLTTPAQGLFRMATADAEVGGVPIAEGDHLFLRFAAANREESKYYDSLNFLLDRADKRHLSFGWGLHTCLGSRLARTELRIAFETLLEHTNSISLSDREDAVVPTGNAVTAGIGELYLDID